ncbi:MAG: hypothetical protein SPJ23_01620, partial [Eubacteriales bacterium]|nr:hypothetical protein [Eubacteriales bacterium]
MKRYSLLKKVITAMSAAVLVLSCGMTAFAAEANLNTDTEQKDIGVYVKYVDNTVWNTVPTDEDGDGTATLPDGTEIEISNADKTKGQLVIDPITDKEALDWINSVTDGKVKAPQAFHIYYFDDTGNLINADGISVSMKPENTLQNPVAYSLKSDGSMELLSANVKNGTITFTTDGSPYYVLGEKDSTISTLPPEIIKGKGQSIVAGENKEVSFTSNAAFSDFLRVELDGKTLDEKYYTVKEGSTIVTLKADYVATLSVGVHTISIVSTNGTATTTFTINAKEAVNDDKTKPEADNDTADNDKKSPQTGENSHMALWIALLAASVFGLAGTAVYSKRKRVR